MVEWDPEKADENQRKHGIDFADAATVLLDEHSIHVRADRSTEQRHAVLGFDRLGRLLAVIYTWRESGQRIISARRASRRERRAYEAARK
jgi:uncharacterized DUF497 family protein